MEFIGYVGHFNSSETMKREGPAIDLEHIEAMAKAQEYVGFDRVLIAFNSTSAESILVAQHIANVTQRLKVMIAHRPGFTAPTLAARQLATLDHISRGRVGVHIITGGNDIELAQDGDHLTKDERYARTSEYLDIVRQEWTSATPFDYVGKHYRVDRGFGDIKPYGASGIPVYFGGASDAAVEVAGKHADIYALWGETYEQVRELVRRVRGAAAPFGTAPSSVCRCGLFWRTPRMKPGQRRIASWHRRLRCESAAAAGGRRTTRGRTCRWRCPSERGIAPLA